MKTPLKRYLGMTVYDWFAFWSCWFGILLWLVECLPNWVAIADACAISFLLGEWAGRICQLVESESEVERQIRTEKAEDWN